MAATPQTTTYKFKDVTCVLGPILMDGFGEGEGITIEHTSAAFTMVVGSDGKVTRSCTQDESGSATVTLAQSSATNDQLSLLLNADRLAPNGVGVVPFMLRDRSGRALFAGADAWVEGPPAAGYKRDVETRAWKISIGQIKSFIAGN